MFGGISSYYDLFSASLAGRYLRKLDDVLDHWEAHFLRRGYEFLQRGIPEGAISALNYLELPPERRAAAFAGPMPVTPITDREARGMRYGLERLLAAEEARVAFPAPPAAAPGGEKLVRFA
ncbi:hypothetical protein [Inquilinus limosus]|uniref:hypothetical protein n=1 Tax=Inquilinus limosus TaxID=171674 RepID=UPI00047AC965|nr:hypothetical protein [Inquilinus limosus]